MVLTDMQIVDDCLGGSRYYDLFFDRPWHRDAILALRERGELDFHPEFARPFFQFKSPLQYILKGLEGEPKCRLIIPLSNKDIILEEIRSYFR